MEWAAATYDEDGNELTPEVQAVDEALSPWIIVLNASYLFPGGWINHDPPSTAFQSSTTRRPTAHAELRSAVAVSKSIAAI